VARTPGEGIAGIGGDQQPGEAAVSAEGALTLPFTPLGPVVIVRPKAAPAPSSPGGLVQLADTGYQPETCGLVVAVGSSFRCEACDETRPPTVAVGEWVLFGRGAGGELDHGGTTYLVLHETEILAVIDDPALAVEMV
jgi:chaperonin GroES